MGLVIDKSQEEDHERLWDDTELQLHEAAQFRLNQLYIFCKVATCRVDHDPMCEFVVPKGNPRTAFASLAPISPPH